MITNIKDKRWSKDKDLKTPSLSPAGICVGGLGACSGGPKELKGPDTIVQLRRDVAARLIKVAADLSELWWRLWLVEVVVVVCGGGGCCVLSVSLLFFVVFKVGEGL